MNKIILLVVVIFLSSFKITAQTITLNIDKFQCIRYPKQYENINDARLQDSIEYLNSGTTNIDYTFNIDDSLLVYQFDKQRDSLKIVYFDQKAQGYFEIWAFNPRAAQILVYNYLISTDSSNNLIFLCRRLEGEKIAGWFAPSINCFSYTKDSKLMP